MRLFIAEKPATAKAIAAELGVTGRGEGYIACGATCVTWCLGHMLEQADPDAYLPADVPASPATGKKLWRAEDLPIIPQRWQLRPRADARQQLKVIGQLLKHAAEVIHAGDPDREGQLLIDDVLAHFGSRQPVRRFWVSAQDAVSIRRGLAALEDNARFTGFGAAARQRSRADWLIGMNLSRAYTLRARRGGAQVLLTIGRVQTPTLGLVVERDRTIESFEPVPFHTVSALIRHGNGMFRATWRPVEGQAGVDDNGRLVDFTVANAVVQAVSGQAGTVVRHVHEAGTGMHPRALALSDLTLLASNRFGYTAETVLKACQALYETHRLISYPRTDCGYLPESQHADAPRVLAALRRVDPELIDQIDGADSRVRSATWDDHRITAHHGIIPTMHEGSVKWLTTAERRIHALVVRAYLAQFYPPHEFMSTKVEVRVADETFVASGKLVTRVGWKALYAAERRAEQGRRNNEVVSDDDPDAEESHEQPQGQPLPAMRQSEPVSCVGADRQDSKTRPPPRFTEGTLGKAMENIHRFVTDPAQRKILREGDGIGTPATRASIIAELRRRRFLDAHGKYLLSTPLGRGLIDTVPEVVRNPLLTAVYERVLKDIEQGQGDARAFLDQQEQFIRDQVARANDGAVIDRDACHTTLAGPGGRTVFENRDAQPAAVTYFHAPRSFRSHDR